LFEIIALKLGSFLMDKTPQRCGVFFHPMLWKSTSKTLKISSIPRGSRTSWERHQYHQKMRLKFRQNHAEIKAFITPRASYV
jgi:hypothetical protein